MSSLDELRELVVGGVGVCTDTRVLGVGEVFVALRGPRRDGHDFVVEALRKGAVAAVVGQSFADAAVSEERLVRVSDPLGAYQAAARWRREQFSGPVVAVTGSVGKTTTKELIVAALGTAGPVLGTEGNFNHETGVPMALLRLEAEHRYAVIEMGMRGPGQIRELGQIALPDVAVITNVGAAHIGLLGSREAIAQAKCELLQCLPPAGVAIINADDPLLTETAAAVWTGRTIGYGFDRGALRAQLVGDHCLRIEGQDVPLPWPGRHHGYNLLATLAVARELGVPWDSLLMPLLVELPGGRARRVELGDGVVILDETYNAGPESMVAALRLLAPEPAQRRIAVLGAMNELGEHSVQLHREVGRAAAAAGVDLLLVLAPAAEARALVEGAAGIPSHCFDNHEALSAHLQSLLQPGDCVLLKASRAVALERVVAALQASPGASP